MRLSSGVVFLAKSLRAIDLYSGIGGWALGLRNAGIDVVSSYEWWKSAATTEEKNLQIKVNLLDIRQLDLSTLPPKIDIVVGSPPCTQFSYANRGGSGDIADGLKYIVKFLEVVEHLKPKFWVTDESPAGPINYILVHFFVLIFVFYLNILMQP